VLADGTPLPYDAETHLITYQGVVDAPGLTQAQLYTRAQDWLAKVTSATSVPQAPATTDQLVGKGTWPVTVSNMMVTYPAGVVAYTLTLYLKEGRYKYVLTNLTHASDGSNEYVLAAGPLEQDHAQPIAMGVKRHWQGVRKQADTSARKLVIDLQNAMKGPAKDPKDF